MRRFLNRPRRGRALAALLLARFTLSGCRGMKTVGKEIPAAHITSLVCTWENINYNAHFQRYRFDVEDGAVVFSHETRSRPGRYGPTTEADITAAGSFELTPAERETLLSLLSGGTVTAREEAVTAGDDGPWIYLYWRGDRDRDQAFSFPDPARQQAFVEFCAGLAKSR